MLHIVEGSTAANFNVKCIGARWFPAVASGNVFLESHIHRGQAGTTAAAPGVNPTIVRTHDNTPRSKIGFLDCEL